jgi:hypothetical protein
MSLPENMKPSRGVRAKHQEEMHGASPQGKLREDEAKEGDTSHGVSWKIREALTFPK